MPAPTTLDSYTDIKYWVQSQFDEFTDGTSDFEVETQLALIDAWRDLTTEHPWLCLMKNPPGAFVTFPAVTSYTLTIPSVGASVACTLSATYPTTLVGKKIFMASRNYSMTITAHTAGTDAVTLDATQEIVTAQAMTIYQDEYDLASDLGLFINGLWTIFGYNIEQTTEARLRAEYPGPLTGDGWPPVSFARIGQSRIRLATYPTTAMRVEYPYTYEPADPSGSDALVLEPSLRPVYALGALATLMMMKSDARAATKMKLYEDRKAKAWFRDQAKHRAAFGGRAGSVNPGLYQ